jgi:hypothetical protein
MLISVVVIYLLVAVYTAGYTVYHSITLGRRVRLFELDDRAVLALIAIGTGLAWPLFLPGLIVVAARYIRRRVSEPGFWSLRTTQVRVES